MIEFADWTRYAGATLSLTALFTWIWSATHQWDAFDARAQRVTVAVGAILGVMAYGFVEAAQQNAPFGWRVAAMCLALIGLIGALTWPPRWLLRLVRRGR